MKFMTKWPLWQQMMAGIVVGALVGYLWPEFGKSLQPVGTALIKLMKMVVVPLVFSAVVTGVYNMAADLKSLGKMAALTFGWFYFATACCCAIGIAVNELMHPGVGVSLAPTGSIPPSLAHAINWLQFFLDLIPDNVLDVAAAGKMLPFLVFCIAFGLALGMLEDQAKPFIDLLQIMFEAMIKIVDGILRVTPIAVACILAWVFASQGGAMIYALSKLLLSLYIGLFIVVALFILLVSLLGYKPILLIKRISAALIIGFSTCSSEGALPILLEELTAMGVPQKIPSFVLPIGYTFNLDGSALYQALAICFIAEAYGMQLNFPALLTILLTTLIASKGTANVPAGSLVAMAVVLSAIGLPPEAIAILAGVDRMMDMGRTTVNVLGNTFAVLLLNRFFGNRAAPKFSNARGNAAMVPAQ
jgi:dicarboxylate/amino acid:cation (Na+ or H+) symporter, DAACS family